VADVPVWQVSWMLRGVAWFSRSVDIFRPRIINPNVVAPIRYEKHTSKGVPSLCTIFLFAWGRAEGALLLT